MSEPLEREDVWVVEDDRALLSGMVSLLREQGLTVLGYGDPKRALADALARPPRLVITDLAMPELNGIELARGLRTALAASCPRILLLTATEVRRVDLTLFDHVVRKPFQFAELLAKVRAYITPTDIRRSGAFARFRRVGKNDAEGSGT